MFLKNERDMLINQGMTRTQASMALYDKYYHLLFRFAEDLHDSSIKQICIENGFVKLISKDGVILNCPEGDVGVLAQWLILSEYESAEYRIMSKIISHLSKNRRTMGSSTVFLDIGANVGWYSLLFSKLIDNIDIHSFEPGEMTYKQFLINIELNKAEHITPNNIGLADHKGMRDFYVCDNMLAASSLGDTLQDVKKTKYSYYFDTLDNYCLQKGIFPDYIKCDVEGAELLVIKGGIETLSERKPVLMVELLRKWCKCFSYHPNDVITLLKGEDMGYSCYVSDGDRLSCLQVITEDTEETNFFFLHRQAHADLISILT